MGKTKKGIKNLDIIKSMMPGGSVIGCPKISTLQLLNNQEKKIETSTQEALVT